MLYCYYISNLRGQVKTFSKVDGENLFQIGAVTKILGVPRKAILVYENMGLLTPAVKDEKKRLPLLHDGQPGPDPLHSFSAEPWPVAQGGGGVLL